MVLQENLVFLQLEIVCKEQIVFTSPIHEPTDQESASECAAESETVVTDAIKA